MKQCLRERERENREWRKGARGREGRVCRGKKYSQGSTGAQGKQSRTRGSAGTVRYTVCHGEERQQSCSWLHFTISQSQPVSTPPSTVLCSGKEACVATAGGRESEREQGLLEKREREDMNEMSLDSPSLFIFPHRDSTEFDDFFWGGGFVFDVRTHHHCLARCFWCCAIREGFTGRTEAQKERVVLLPLRGGQTLALAALCAGSASNTHIHCL